MKEEQNMIAEKEMDIDRIVAETDMIAFIDEVVCDAGAFGFGTNRDTEQSQSMSIVMNYLEEAGLEREHVVKVEPLLLNMQISSEKEAFKRGFNIALRIMIEGLNAGRSN